MWRIKDIKINNRLVLAPLAGITTLPYRLLAKSFGAGLVYSEMISDKALIYNNELTYKMIRVDKNEHPVAVQLFGGDLESMVAAAKILDTRCDCDIIDINMGCPIPKVLKANAGSKWLLDPNKAYEIVKKIVESVNKPVTCKIRLGWDKNSINCLEYAKLMEKAGVSCIAVHARTKSQMYHGSADWSYIKLIKDNLSIPVIGNGDVVDEISALRMLEETGCDAVMIGRGALGNPFIFSRINHFLAKKELSSITANQKIQVCLDFAKSLIEYYQNEASAIKEMRSHACWFIKGLPNANLVKDRIHQTNTYIELEDVLLEFAKTS